MKEFKLTHSQQIMKRNTALILPGKTLFIKIKHLTFWNHSSFAAVQNQRGYA